jgi:autotransporter-associated beta strand protein
VLAADLTSQLVFLDDNGFAVGSVDGDVGIVSTGGVVDLRAVNIDVQQPINAGTGLVDFLAPLNGQALDLGGGDGPNVLGVTDAELGRITAGLLAVNGDGVTISSAITRHAGYNTLVVSSGASGSAIIQLAPLSVAHLGLSARGNATLTDPGNDVDTLAASGFGVGTNLFYNDVNGFAVDDQTFFEIQGIQDWSSANLTAGGAITDGNGSALNVSSVASLTMTAVGGIDLDVDVGTLSASSSGNGPITFGGTGGTIKSLIGGSGGTTITLDGGTFALAGNNVIAGAPTFVLAGAVLDLAGFGENLTNVRLTDGTVRSTAAGGILSSFNPFDVGNALVTGTLGGSAGLVKSTAGTVVLAGANAYTGTTTVNDGTLLVTGSLGGGRTSVIGGTLGGTGTVGPLTAVGGTVAPGTTGPGILTANGNVTILVAALAVDLNGQTAGSQYDQLKVNGTVSLAAPLNLNVAAGFAPPAGTQFVIIDNDGTDPVSGSFVNLPEGATVTANGLSFTISYRGGTGNDVVLTRTAAPPLAVSSVALNAGQANLVQRSLVSNVTVTFSRLVSFAGSPADVFQLVRFGPGAPTGNVTLAADLSGSTATQTIVRLTFSGPLTDGANSLIDGNYTLTVLNNQIQGGVQGGDNLTSLFRLFGDVNGDKAVDGFDLTAFRNAFGSVQGNASYVPFLDFNGDGAIDGADLTQFRNRFGVILP